VYFATIKTWLYKKGQWPGRAGLSLFHATPGDDGLYRRSRAACPVAGGLRWGIGSPSSRSLAQTEMWAGRGRQATGALAQRMCFLDENRRQLCEPTQCLFGSECIPPLLSLLDPCCGHAHHILPQGEEAKVLESGCGRPTTTWGKSIPESPEEGMGRLPKACPGWNQAGCLGCHPGEKERGH
jgi:hypothetical protein